jgi:hypothetical protein
MSGTFYAQAQPRIGKELAAAAARGVRVRVCFGDPASDAVAVRDREEGLGGTLVYYDSDGETRQEYEIIFTGRPESGTPAVNDEASDVRWVAPGDLAALDIHPTQRRQLGRWLDGAYPHVGSRAPSRRRHPDAIRQRGSFYTAPYCHVFVSRKRVPCDPQAASA